jgi:glycosyltransferase involved in cell wall biosynthesis
MITSEKRTSVPPHPGKTATNRFLFIVSDWQGAMIRPGGICSYIDGITGSLITSGDSVKLLAVFRADERESIGNIESYGSFAIPFRFSLDEKPTGVLGRKLVSLLEILRCVSPTCRRVVERTSFLKASTQSIASFERLLSKEDPTAIVFGNFDMRLYPIALSLRDSGRPYGIIAHGCEVALPSKRKTNDLVIRKAILRGASWIAANSRHTKSLLDEWRIPSDRIDIIYPPISEEVMTESAALKAGNTNGDDFRLLTLCRLVKGKGIDLVLRALAILVDRGIPYQYVIGGDGPERESLEALATQLGLRDRVHFEGPVEGQEKWRLLRDADVYVMPSRFVPEIPWQESFGIAFAEAAAFGVPAVGSKSGGIPDAVIDGKTGILVAEESPADVADALTFLYRNPEKKRHMGWAARERARRQFSPQAIAACFRHEVSKGICR